MEWNELTAIELKKRLDASEFSARELTQACLDRIQKLDGQIAAFLEINQQALAQADRIDQRRARGEPLGLLAGIPVAVKDILCNKETRTTCASKMLENFAAPYDATVISKLKAADAVLVGRTNMDEFAMGSSTENSAYQITRNPWNTDCIPGGSSGGSAACVAARMTPLAIGTDTGGSIRQPAALCGVVGLKPTYGRVSRYGLIAFASSLDQIGPFARTAEDAALLLQVIAGEDTHDSTCARRAVPDYRQSLQQPLTGLRIGIPEEHLSEGVDDEVRDAINAAADVYRSLGATISSVHLPMTKHGIATYYVVAPCEASSNLARYDGAHYGYRYQEEENLDLVSMYCKTRGHGFGAEVKRRIMLGTYALSEGYDHAYYIKAAKVRRLISDDFRTCFAGVDLILGPTTPTPAFKIGEKSSDPLAMYLADIFTVTTNLAGLPAISIPCGFSSAGLPIGLQLQAPWFEEGRLLSAAQMFQNETDWHTRSPALS
jgi:aspartyl-tRNA(Asn)/glutamyl-tRNA(Gln) amidotransferase subunit A